MESHECYRCECSSNRFSQERKEKFHLCVNEHGFYMNMCGTDKGDFKISFHTQKL